MVEVLLFITGSITLTGVIRLAFFRQRKKPRPCLMEQVLNSRRGGAKQAGVRSKVTFVSRELSLLSVHTN